MLWNSFDQPVSVSFKTLLVLTIMLYLAHDSVCRLSRFSNLGNMVALSLWVPVHQLLAACTPGSWMIQDHLSFMSDVLRAVGKGNKGNWVTCLSAPTRLPRIFFVRGPKSKRTTRVKLQGTLRSWLRIHLAALCSSPLAKAHAKE